MEKPLFKWVAKCY